MPYDASAPTEVTARDRMIQLRDFLETLPPERFNIRSYFAQNNLSLITPDQVSAHDCGTSACIAGWAVVLYGGQLNPWGDDADDIAAAHLGLNDDEAYELFFPPGFNNPRMVPTYTTSRAVAVLDHYLATGKIDWSAATNV